jgi:type I restriction enzyme M protein
MDLKNSLTLRCPIRGELKASKKGKDGLTPTEEYFRVEAIKYLLKNGYPKENFKIEPIIKKFGNSGRNSFRSDFAVLDVPADTIDTKDPEVLLSHALLICEVKKDNAKSDYVKHTQVKPMLDFSKLDKCVGLYWDNIEQRVFWQEKVNNIRETKEAPLSFIPAFGDNIKTKSLTFNDTLPSDSLLDIFSRIEDILHQASFDPERRYEIILQLLLTKIFDEHAFEPKPEAALGVQDYSVLGTSPQIAKDKFEKILDKAISYYEKHLPNKIPKTLPITGETLIEILKILAPIRIIHSKRDVVQTFYMKFAKDLYKWDLAQYFTPTTVTDFIIDVLNPQFGEHIADPACGSADFLVAAFRIGRHFSKTYADCVWGVDNSANAVQISVLNMLLNGDGKTNIKKDDSLENIKNYAQKYDILVCNPPFGAKILEKRKSVLKNFDLGFEWTNKNGVSQRTDKLLDGQETGLLFVEVCVKQCKPGGRIGIILPNGYLGNRSNKFHYFREWLLRHTKIAAIASFPRFTFKTSGADVSASVIFLEKRDKPLNKIEQENYSFAVEMIENVGWDAGNKKAAPIYKRNIEDGSFIINDEGDLIIDSDFDDAVGKIRVSNASKDFDWLVEGLVNTKNKNGWSINIKEVINDPDLTLDPKRYCRKVKDLRQSLQSMPHFTLGELVDFLPEKFDSIGKSVKSKLSNNYKYVEIQNIGYGEYNFEELKGWQLPSRARHFAEEGDLYFGSIWGSVAKWCYVGKGMDEIVVTNGCHRCRVKIGMENNLLDLIAYMNTEGWATQMRSFARGSDGLAEVSIEDAKKVIIPKIEKQTLRNELQPYVENLKESKFTLNNTISIFLNRRKWEITEPSKRPSHIVLV